MRAKEFINLMEYINKDVMSLGFSDEQSVLDNKFIIKAETISGSGPDFAGIPLPKFKMLAIEVVDAQNPEKVVATAKFKMHGALWWKNLQAKMINVVPDYRRQGIATAVYQYVSKLGNTIKPSNVQLTPGQEMWKGFKRKHSLGEPGVAEGTDPDKKYTIKKSYTMSKAGVEKAVWYIMDGDFVVDVTDLRRDAKYYADKWNAAEKESSNASQNPHKPAVAEGSQTECPPATQDITLNLKNRQKAIDEYGYGPLNPDMPNTKFWMKKVDEWNLDSAEEAKQSLCGNCAAFDQRQHTLDCIAQGIDSDNPEDAEGIIDAGELGYCKFLKFKCASRRTCDAWVTGGPLVDKQSDSGR